ncbi:hypothetical protein ACFPM3_20495 [Streptomyces coeruleoprunus]|uniref:DUF2293 domain-containing protein n=1 Tax=Streptomyces coeruleoprunus TaxID=285563 RepID=A0ABV9XGP0_9ACTN
MKPIERMTDQELQIIKECLDAAVSGPFFPDWEFHSLMGFTRDEIAAVAASWPSPPIADTEDDAVNNVLTNLLGYPHGVESRWHECLPATRDQVAQVLARWRGEDVVDQDPGGNVEH